MSLVSLWLPILVSAVLVFFASFLLHMVIPFHKGDYRKLPAEDESMEAMRKLSIPPGDYMVPCAGSPDAMKSPEFKEKFAKGPVLTMTVTKPGTMDLGGSLGQWFVYCLATGVMVAYVTSRAAGSAPEPRQILRFAGVTGFLAHGWALLQMSVWYKRNWGTTARYLVDGLIFGILTGLVFMWMWPKP